VSVEAITWALRDAPDVPAHLVSTLIALANHAGPDGRAAFPGQKLLAEYTRKTERAVRKDLIALAELGLIREGDQRLVGHYRADKRPVVYDLALERVRVREFERTPSAGMQQRSRLDRAASQARSPRLHVTAANGQPAREIRSQRLAAADAVTQVRDALGIDADEARQVVESVMAGRDITAPSRYIATLVKSGDLLPHLERVRRTAAEPLSTERAHAWVDDGSGVSCGECGLPPIHPSHRVEGAPAALERRPRDVA
jgi:hypothetical protein